MKHAIQVEVCIDSVEGALAAAAGGADRVELCADLVEGGTTPSAGTIAAVREAVGIGLGLVVLVRPRAGDFLYSPAEIDVLHRDIAIAKAAGADGVAIGMLARDGRVDSELVGRASALARPMQVTFHRAFDLTSEPFEALEALLALGVDRLLTSGQAPSAPEGAALLGSIVQRAEGRLAVMAGGGVRAENVRALVDDSGVPEVHFSAAVIARSPMEFRSERCRMGASRAPGEYERRVTDVDAVRRAVAALAEVRPEVS